MQVPENDAPLPDSPPSASPPPIPPTPPSEGPAHRRPGSRFKRSEWPAEKTGPAPLDLTRVFSLTFSTFFKNLHRLFVISLVVFSPILICGGLYVAVVGRGEASDLVIALLLAMDLLFLHHLLTAALVSGVNQELKGGTLSVGDSLQAAISHVVAVTALGVMTLVGLWLGFVLLIVPGVLLLCSWCTAFPALMEEGIGPRAALERSAKLTKGSRLAVFSVLILLLLAIYSAMSFGMLPIMLIFREGGGGAVYFLVGQFILIFGRSLLAVLSAVLYHELRVGFDAVFSVGTSSMFQYVA